MPQPDALTMTIAGRTDVGRVRSRNEDSFGFNSETGLAVVCDGMGGHAGGDVASRTAANAIIDFVAEFPPEPDAQGGAMVGGTSAAEQKVRDAVSITRSAVHLANQRLLELNRERGFTEGRGMGTTVVGLYRVSGTDRLVAFHAGDSRLYRLRDRELSQLTRDHSLYQLWLDNGGKGPAPQRNVIVRALGTSPDLEPDIGVHTVLPGDLFLLCSDGLTAMLSDAEIAAILEAKGLRPLNEACEHLVAAANERGGIDNVTVVLVHCSEAPD